MLRKQPTIDGKKTIVVDGKAFLFPRFFPPFAMMDDVAITTYYNSALERSHFLCRFQDVPSICFAK